MTTVIETKTLGIDVSINGTFVNTIYDNGVLSLKLKDGSNNVYESQGSWTSGIVDIGDNFREFGHLVVNNIDNSDATFSIRTRTSPDGITFNQWLNLNTDNTIASVKERYIQIRIEFVAGMDSTEVLYSELVNEKWLDVQMDVNEIKDVPTVTSANPTATGFPFGSASNSATGNLQWNAFDKVSTTYFFTNAVNETKLIGYYFNDGLILDHYSIQGINTNTQRNPTEWYIEGSFNTTTGLDGDWEILDFQTDQNLNALGVVKTYEVDNNKKYKAYRMRAVKNSGTAYAYQFCELNFMNYPTKNLKLKREVTVDSEIDNSWTLEGKLFRNEVVINDWEKINKLNLN